MSNRDKLRALTVGAAKKFREKTVEFGGEKFVVREPSLAESKAIRSKAVQVSAKGQDVKIDDVEFLVQAIIQLVHDEDGVKVFEAGDHEALMGQPAGGFVQVLGQAAVEMFSDAEAEGNA